MAIARDPADRTSILKVKTGPIRAHEHAHVTSFGGLCFFLLVSLVVRGGGSRAPGPAFLLKEKGARKLT